MCRLIKTIFIGLLISIVNAYNHTKCVSLNNNQPTLTDLHPNEYSREFRYYPFSVKLGRCVGNWNTPNDLSNKWCLPKNTKDLNLSMFIMVTGMNVLKMNVNCKFDRRKCNSDQWWNNDDCRCECKKHHVWEKDYVWNPATCSCGNRKYAVSIMDDSAITCDEIVESHNEDAEAKSYDEMKTLSTTFNKKKATCKT